MLIEHSNNVLKLSLAIGEELKLSKSQLYELRFAAVYHDIGKFKIPKEILNKPSKLTNDEMEVMKKHSIYGFEMARDMDLSKVVCKSILHHHEKYNGKGYPEGLYKNNIPLYSRIIAIADSFDAMTSKRAYNKPKSVSEALNEIEINSGSQFDPKISKVFLKIKIIS